MSGYIRLSRKYFEHPLWNEQRIFSPAEAWLDIIATARYDSIPEKLLIKMKMVTISRGELRASIRFLARRWSWSKDRVSRFLNLLEQDTMISRDLRHGEPIVIVLNYNKFNPVTAEFCDSNKDTSKDTSKDTNETATRTEARQQQGQTKESKERIKKDSLFRQRFFSVLEIFYFKNFKNPISVTNAFFNHYEGIGWKNARGLDIENIESVAENWDNKTTQGVNCPPALLVKWKVMYGILKNNTDQYLKFILIRPAKLEHGILTIRGNIKDIQEIDDNPVLRNVWKNTLDLTFGKVRIEYEPDNQPVEA